MSFCQQFEEEQYDEDDDEGDDVEDKHDAKRKKPNPGEGEEGEDSATKADELIQNKIFKIVTRRSFSSSSVDEVQELIEAATENLDLVQFTELINKVLLKRSQRQEGPGPNSDQTA